MDRREDEPTAGTPADLFDPTTMRPINTQAQEIALVTDAATLPSPPTSWGVVAHWGRLSGATPEFDLNVWGSANIDLTAARLLAATPKPVVIADDNVDAVDTTDNELDIAAHAYKTGDGPVRLTTTGVLPGGLALATDYYVIVKAAGSIALATSRENAMRGTSIDLTSAGSGTHTIADTADTKRIRWMHFGLIGPAGDGAVALTALSGYTTRARHSPLVVAYALAGTASASGVSASISPVVEV